MPKSMTGYGAFELSDEKRKITVEIKSVNNRYADINIKLRSSYIFLEEDIRNTVLKTVSRGKIDIFVTVWEYKNETAEVTVDEELLKQYVNALKKISETMHVSEGMTAERLSRYPDVLVVSQNNFDKDVLKESVLTALDGALKEFVAAREREGERICEKLGECIDGISVEVDKVEQRMPQIVENYRMRLENKLKEVLENTAADESRIVTEAAIFADKICTDEETVRLKSHIAEFKDVLKSEQPIGRKLDFIIQEMNREINTIGSKCNDAEVSKIVVGVKGEIEKLREQVQNIE